MINKLINSTLVNLSILVKDILSKCPDKIELGNFPFSVLSEKYCSISSILSFLYLRKGGHMKNLLRIIALIVVYLIVKLFD